MEGKVGCSQWALCLGENCEILYGGGRRFSARSVGFAVGPLERRLFLIGLD